MLNRLARACIERAARSAPSSLATRLEEEWLAELTVRGGAVSRLCFATGCYWASKVITRQGWAGNPAAPVAVYNGRALALRLEIHSRIVSRRAAVLFFIFALHVLMIYALLSVLDIRVGGLTPGALEVSVSQDLLPRPQPPPPPRPVLTVPKIAIPRPDVDLSLPIDPRAIRAPPQANAAASTPTRGSIQRPDVVVLGGPGRGFPNTDDYYPEFARRLEQSGIATLHVCVDMYGTLTSTPELAHSSGYSAIDRAALNLARAGSGHYRPTTDNGAPVRSCFEYLIRFTLRV
jgi:protein TonB